MPEISFGGVSRQIGQSEGPDLDDLEENIKEILPDDQTDGLHLIMEAIRESLE